MTALDWQDEYSRVCGELHWAKAELSEARAQIHTLQNQLVEAALDWERARAQIAAKDAEIERAFRRGWAMKGAWVTLDTVDKAWEAYDPAPARETNE